MTGTKNGLNNPMTNSNLSTAERQAAVDKLKEAAMRQQLSVNAVSNVSLWLEDGRYANYASEVAEHIQNEQWDALEEVFWTTIPFGTAGRRGKMYPIGCNAINDRTMGETAQATAEYVAEYLIDTGPEATPRPKLSCAIGYDTRHRSRHFAELCAEVMVAHGFHVHFLDGHQATPLLSTTIRQLGCSCGIMVTASHNPPSDNAAKVFWSTGAQLKPPHDEGVTTRLQSVDAIRRTPFDTARGDGRITFCQEEMREIYHAAVLDLAFPPVKGERNLDIVFSPLHGVGTGSIVPVLQADGFKLVEVFAPHAEPDGDFPNVPNHIANPESPAVFDAIIDYAKTTPANLILASDPDADRIGCAAPLSMDNTDWATLSGNQIGVLIADYVLTRRDAAGTLTPDHFLVKTLVTTDMYHRIGAAFGIRVTGECLTGFKWIGGLVDSIGADHFIMGTEEAHGYLLGTFARDKDAAGAAMLLAELADEAVAEQQTVHDRLDDCFRKYGCHQEKTIAKVMPGADGMQQMKAIMERFRSNPPSSIAGLVRTETRDYLTQTVASASDEKPMDGPTRIPKSNVIVMHFGPTAWAAVRPSGTEPKIKFYLFASSEPKDDINLDAEKVRLQEQLASMEADLLQLSNQP